MNEQTNNLEDWRTEVSEGDSRPTLKIADKEQVVFTFKDEGTKKHHADFGDSVLFKVSKKNTDGEDEDMSFYVNANNWSLRKQIKDLGTLTNLKVKLSREGSKKSDTRYTIVKADAPAEAPLQ